MEKSKSTRTVVAIPSDTHGGSTVGLIPDKAWELTSGGTYIPNELQMLIWAQWIDCWKMVKKLRERSRLVVIHAGDAVEGIHHDATWVVSLLPEEHQRIHIAGMKHALDVAGMNAKGGDRIYYVGGTNAHVSPGHASEEAVARELGATPLRSGSPDLDYQDGRYVWEHLRLTINGVLVDISHHGPAVGSRAWLKGNNLRLALRSVYYNCLDNRLPIPRYWVRAHRHRWATEIFRGNSNTIEGFLTPCFQGHTDYAFRVAADELTNIGMLVLVIEPDGCSDWYCDRIQITPDKIEEL